MFDLRKFFDLSKNFTVPKILVMFDLSKIFRPPFFDLRKENSKFLAHFALTFAILVDKVCPIENNTNLNSIFCLIKSSKIDLIFYLHFI